MVDLFMGILIIGITISMLLFVAYKIFNFIFEDHVLGVTLWRRRKEVSKFDRAAIKTILKRKVPYFNALSIGGKEKFLNRVLNHYIGKEFISQEGQVITREVKTLISAGAAQLTFGLDFSFLRYFPEYHVYPRSFKLSKRHPRMYGATSPKGLIWFSWAHVEKGYEDYSDGVNLAIHEFAHALYLQHRQGMVWEADWLVIYENWMAFAHSKLRNASAQERKFFRRDIRKIPTELFPVMVEEFFERPNEFVRAFPDIYVGLVRLMNQDPRNAKLDYRPKMRGFFG